MIMKEKMWGWGKWLDQKIEKNVGVGGSEKNPFPPPYTIKNGTALSGPRHGFSFFCATRDLAQFSFKKCPYLGFSGSCWNCNEFKLQEYSMLFGNIKMENDA